MFSIYKKELKQFFGNSSGYIILSIFLIFCGLYLFFFETEFNIFNNHYASLNNFFTLAPWGLIFIIPAFTMHSFAGEKQAGTLELLFAQPLSKIQIVFAKYIAVLTAVLMTLLLTVCYVYSLQELVYFSGKLDTGVIFSGYLGLLLLSSCFSAVGVYISAITKNSIAAYLVTIFICFFLYFGFINLASYNLLGTYDYWVAQIGLFSHYEKFIKGILSIKSFFYISFLSLFFLLSAYCFLKSTRKKYLLLIYLFLLFSMLFFSNLSRLDLTQDKRYTLTNITEKIMKKVEFPVKIEVYLKGKFPADLRNFNTEIKRQLQELQQINPKIKFQFIDPFKSTQTINILKKYKINPIVKRIRTDEGKQEFYIYPYARVIYQKKQLIFPLIKDLNLPVKSNIENLEFNFTKAISELIQTKKKKIGILTHHGEFDPATHKVFINNLENKYEVMAFTPQSRDKLSPEEARSFQRFDALLIVKPKTKFTDTDREAIDQYIMNGGKTLWLIDGVNTEIDSLSKTGNSIVLARDLGLTPLLFKYGIRINHDLIQDYSQCAAISLITDQYNGKPVFTDFKWAYYPLSNYSPTHHPIVKNIAPVRFEFVSTIDTLSAPSIKKTILLTTSRKTFVQGTLTRVDLNSVNIEPDLSKFRQKNKIMAVLLEGKFSSAFTHRVHSFNFPYKNLSSENKMIMVSDGDIAKNTPTKKSKEKAIIGGDRSGRLYGNKDFLMNSIDYLLDNNHLFLLKNKTFDVQLLDPAKLQVSKSYYKWFNLIVPLALLWLIGVICMYYRYWKYEKS